MIKSYMPVDKKDKNNNIAVSIHKTREKRKGQVCVVYIIKIDFSKLSKKQREQLKMLFVEAKWIYNDALNYSKENNIFTYRVPDNILHYDKDRQPIETALSYISAQMKQSVVDQLFSSIKTMSTLKRKGFKVGQLKYISTYKSINLKQYGHTYNIVGKNKITIQKVSGKIRVNGLDQITDIENVDFANAKLLQKASGYYLAITTYTDKPVEDDKIEKPLIGINFGCTTALTLSNGDKIDCSIPENKRLKNLQRKLAKKKKGSNMYYNVCQQLRREYEHISNQKNDIANKIVSDLLRNYKVIMQDEQIAEWQKGSWTSSTVQHSILGRVKRRLMRCPDTVVLSKWFPTTKLCSCCGRRLELTLDDRQFVCECGVKEDRDIHAANNMIYIYDKIIGTGHTELLDRSKRDDKKALDSIKRLL